MRVVREVMSWWGGLGLAGWLYIPKSKQEEIKQKFADVIEQKKESICYWINTNPLASWRRLIWTLDYMQQHHLADSIRPNAEPLTGSHHSYSTVNDMPCGMQMVLNDSLLNLLTPMCMCIARASEP